MRKLTEEEIKQRELNILIFIDKICRENNLEYFLAFGTLIGAIRHKGFIPWDDDIDIVMKRSDYEKFISLFPKNNEENFKLLNVESNDEYYYPFLKVVDTKTKVEEVDFKVINNLGVWVDIFPLDNYDPSVIREKEVTVLKNKLQLSRATKCIKTKSIIKTIVKNIIYPFYKYKDPKKYGILINELGKKSKNSEKNYCILFALKFKNGIYKKELYDKKIEWNFEGHEFFIPEKYHDILTQVYGDYMQLPPEKQRVSGHNIEAFLIE